MRRLSLLVALAIPLAFVAIDSTPSAAACTPPVCRLQNCEFIFEAPRLDREDPDIGLVGVECGDDEE